MNNRKCLFIDQYAGVAGGQVIFLNLLSSALDAGLPVTAAFPHGGELERRVKNQFGDRLRSIAIPEPKLTRGNKTWIDKLKYMLFSLYFIKLLPLMRQHDLIYVNGPRYYFPAWMASWFIRKQFVYHIHLDHNVAEKRLIRRIAHSAKTHALIANSSFIYERLLSFDRRLARNKKLMMIENSLPPLLSNLPFCNRFGQTSRYHIAIIGRISQGKGQDIVVQLAPYFPACTFFLIGESEEPFTANLRSRIPANVFIRPATEDFIGTINTLPVHYSLVPSRIPESFGMVAIESMAASCITIVSGAGELKNIAERTSCFVYDSLESLTQLLHDLFQKSSEQLEQIAREQYTKTKQHYGFEAFQNQIAAVLAS